MLPKLPGGHHDVDLLAPESISPGAHQITVGGEIVDDLGQQPSPVDGVGAGEQHAVLRQLLPAGRVGKDLLHAGLGVVKISLDGAHMDVAALLGDHLALLHGG